MRPPFRFDETARGLDDMTRVLFNESGAPKRHRLFMPTLSQWWRENQGHGFCKAALRARAAIRDARPVALVGPCGVGKTQMATALIQGWCIATRRAARYRRFADLIADFKSQCFNGRVGEGSWLRHWSAVGLLVIDDLQCCYNTDTERVTLTRLMDHRYDQGLPTVLVSNLDPKAFTDFVGPQVASRLRENGEHVFCNDWPSFRGGAS